MHIFCFEQEGGVGLTLGCREGGGHQRARSSCGQEDREGVKTTDTVGQSLSLFSLVYSVSDFSGGFFKQT